MSFDEIDIPPDVAPPMSELHLHDAPPASRIAWIAGGAKVPVEVAASGPKVIAMAALHAERVMFTLGADVERLEWGIALARKTRKEAGLDPDGIAFGAYVNLGCHTDMDGGARPGARRAHDLRALLGDARQGQRAGLDGRPRRCSRRCAATTT